MTARGFVDSNYGLRPIESRGDHALDTDLSANVDTVRPVKTFGVVGQGTKIGHIIHVATLLHDVPGDPTEG